ncbi:MAG: hypothetical protein KDK39_18805 [Leptospiraceae bacterium]|nr:hypothetical protein [Leptospiraceae bacterium]
MFDFFIWLVLFLIIAGIVLVLCYWVHLFTTRDNYERTELIDFYNIIMGELTRLTGERFQFGSGLALLAGAGMAWLLTLFGGWISPAVAAVPDYASDLATNYFFQSILFIGVLHLMWPALQDYAWDSPGGGGGIAAQMLSQEVPFMFTLGSGLAAMNLMNWGVYHQMNFLVVLLNVLSCAIYAGYRVFQYNPEANRDYNDWQGGSADSGESYDWQPDERSEYGQDDLNYSDIDDPEDYRNYDPGELDRDAPPV